MESTIQVINLINKDARDSLYKIMYIGTTTFSRFLTDYTSYTNSESFKENKTRIFNSFIKRQFETDHLPTAFPFESELKKVNGCNRALFLTDENTKLTIKKGSKQEYRNNASNYLKEEAQNNSPYSQQVSFFITPTDIPKNKRIFMIIEFDIDELGISYLRFAIPDQYLKSSIDTFNGLDEYKTVILGTANTPETEKLIEENIIDLKKITASYTN
ncbi:hypothetical protein [uncultured Clostridium sp.]|uniref:hypothetical protein n=1 Tax=uncultured Clostridium sp. TaxID=59620 RepID=UPI002630C469|nr:hypothetical protein [uncultured Clostridium sp.]